MKKLALLLLAGLIQTLGAWNAVAQPPANDTSVGVQQSDSSLDFSDQGGGGGGMVFKKRYKLNLIKRDIDCPGGLGRDCLSSNHTTKTTIVVNNGSGTGSYSTVPAEPLGLLPQILDGSTTTHVGPGEVTGDYTDVDGKQVTVDNLTIVESIHAVIYCCKKPPPCPPICATTIVYTSHTKITTKDPEGMVWVLDEGDNYGTGTCTHADTDGSSHCDVMDAGGRLNLVISEPIP